MHLVRGVSDGSCFAVAAFVLMCGGGPSPPPRIHFAREVPGDPQISSRKKKEKYSSLLLFSILKILLTAPDHNNKNIIN